MSVMRDCLIDRNGTVQANPGFSFFPVLVIKSGTMKFIDFGHFTLTSTPWVYNGFGINIDGIPSTSTVSHQFCVSFCENLVCMSSTLH
jgi:hypothetical protein